MGFELLSEKVEFRNGSSLTVREATWREDTLLMELELSANERNQAEVKSQDGQEQIRLSLEQLRVQFFRLNIYPKLAACSKGDVPTEDDAMVMPATELNKWFAAARRVNPTWFAVFDKLEDPTPDQVKVETAKKKRRHLKSIPS